MCCCDGKREEEVGKEEQSQKVELDIRAEWIRLYEMAVGQGKVELAASLLLKIEEDETVREVIKAAGEMWKGKAEKKDC